MVFKKGQSGNPAGRPKRKSFHKLLDEMLSLKLRELPPAFADVREVVGKGKGAQVIDLVEDKNKTLSEALTTQLLYRACKGDTALIQSIISRMEGNPKQTNEIDFGDKAVKILTPLVEAIAKRKGMIEEKKDDV
ncbi:hypothetical protein LCGC14_2101980 [marine sediment metagenome]|uniref:DUF5681 domain-containing protein n=1 Tax=marine sediment metagenome TaxID=412755 RepID=A0A0F9GMQ5_9ZZZZ